MCTAIACSGGRFFFGRTLDLDRSYGEEVVITPRNFPLPFREAESMPTHHAIIGMAHVANGYPLCYDAMNEHGLCMAGLRFRPHARYPGGSGTHIAPFELMLWVLGQCKTRNEARALLEQTVLCDISFSPELPNTKLHWLVADKTGSMTVESTADGLHLYDNPVGVLTNDPPFPHQLALLQRGGDLPGDLSSPSRFRRAAFTKTHARSVDTVTDFLKILDTVTQIPGCNGDMATLYSSCCDTENGIYCYSTCHSRRLCGIDMNRVDLDATELMRYPLMAREDIHLRN